MNPKSAFTLFLLVTLGTLAGPGAAETASDTQLSSNCKLVGPLIEATEDCKAVRVAFRTEVGDCMNALKSEAEARAGTNAGNNAHTSRARLLTCDTSVRLKMGLAAK